MDIKQTFRRLWEAACMDMPTRPSVTVTEEHFQLTITGNEAKWSELTTAAGVPATAQRAIEGDVLTCRWPSHADAIFGKDGMIAQMLPNYEVRLPQLHMARLVQRSIEWNEPVVVEAGTGVGKSYAYAAIAMAMNKRILISTSNKALQMQLYRKDIPFLATLFPGKSVALAQGKGNYACRLKCDKGLPNQALAAWYDNTDSGNVEEIDFAVDWKQLATMTVDDDCGGRHCAFYADCFYYDAKAARQAADVVITNHALLCLHQLHPSAGILPNVDLIVVDEAHKLADYARNAIGVEFRLGAMVRTIDLAQGLVEEPDAYNETTLLAVQFERVVQDYLHNARDPKGNIPAQVGLNQAVLTGGAALAESLRELADEVWGEGNLPVDTEGRKRARRAQRIRSLGDKVAAIAAPNDLVRWIESASDAITLKAAPSDVSRFIAEMAGVVTPVTSAAETPTYTHCARCHRTLTADKVAVLDGQPFGPECIKYVDELGDAETVLLADWLAMDHAPAAVTSVTSGGRAIVFCSATLAAPELTTFLREAGLPDALRMVAASPFNYADNAMLYLPNGASPQPTDAAWRDWVVEEMDRLVVASGGGAFLLFTSNAMMNYAAQTLRALWINRFNVMVQGELPKLEIAKRFRDDGNAVLFATKSFFEGVSIDGAALRLVVVDKMPFEAPNPLSAAMEADALDFARNHGYSGKALEMYPFDSLRVPKMIIELKQAAGRLIRTATDTGVIAVLDSRIRATQYGRNKVIPAMPPAPLLSNAGVVADFLRKQRRPKVVVPSITTADRAALAAVEMKRNGKVAPAAITMTTHFAALPVAKAVKVEDDGDVLWA